MRRPLRRLTCLQYTALLPNTRAAGAEPFTVTSQLSPSDPLIPFDPASPQARGFTVRPKAGLAAGAYEAEITIACTGTNPADPAVKASQTAHVKFTVVAPTPTPPQTGDPAPLLPLVGLLLCSSAGLALSVRRRKRA